MMTEYLKRVDPDQLRSEIESAGVPYVKGLLTVSELWDALTVDADEAFMLEHGEAIAAVVAAHVPLRRRALVERAGAGPARVMDALGVSALACEGEVGRVVATVPASLTGEEIASALDSYEPPAPVPTATSIVAAIASVNLDTVSTVADLKAALTPVIAAAAAVVEAGTGASVAQATLDDTLKA
jgi:hypothetical protein